eukprot:5982119-Pleurochrysis_carterae.AAC.1
MGLAGRSPNRWEARVQRPEATKSSSLRSGRNNAAAGWTALASRLPYHRRRGWGGRHHRLAAA